VNKSQLKQIIKEEVEGMLRERGIQAYTPGHPISRHDEEYYGDQEALAEEEGEESERTAKGNITQPTREKHATVGKDKFPIFDKKSAEAAIDLRGHAPEADRAKIINKAAKYAPAAAKKAREADKKD